MYIIFTYLIELDGIGYKLQGYEADAEAGEWLYVLVLLCFIGVYTVYIRY